MSYVLTFFHIVVCIFADWRRLAADRQAADLAGAFGGGGSQTRVRRARRRDAALADHDLGRGDLHGHVLRPFRSGQSPYRAHGSVLEDQIPASTAPDTPSTPPRRAPGHSRADRAVVPRGDTVPDAPVPSPASPPAGGE